MAKLAKRRKRPDPVPVIEPTPEQMDKGDFARQLQPDKQAAPFRRVPVIFTLADQGKITQRQFLALARYRDVATADDHSPLKDSLAKMMEGSAGGAGLGLPPSALRTSLDRGWLERELGSLLKIAEAIALRDTTLSQWAMRGRSIERRQERAGKVVVWFEPYRSDYKIALADIRMAGERLAAAISS